MIFSLVACDVVLSKETTFHQALIEWFQTLHIPSICNK